MAWASRYASFDSTCRITSKASDIKVPVARLPIEAIQMLTGEIDLLVKDVVMSGIDGGVIAQRLRPLYSNMRIL
jgi:CheY-like chemotaxis protein